MRRSLITVCGDTAEVTAMLASAGITSRGGRGRIHAGLDGVMESAGACEDHFSATLRIDGGDDTPDTVLAAVAAAHPGLRIVATTVSDDPEFVFWCCFTGGEQTDEGGDTVVGRPGERWHRQEHLRAVGRGHHGS